MSVPNPPWSVRLRDHAQDLDGSGHLDAAEVPYDHTSSGLTATDVQAAIDELAGGGGTITLDDLADVTITSPAAGDRLRYDGAGQWRNVHTVWKPVLLNNPAIVTSDGSAVYVPWTTVDGDPIMAESPL